MSPASIARRDPAILACWQQLLDQCTGTTLLYQSPEYFDHLALWNPDDAFLAIVDGDDGAPIGIVPIRKAQLSLTFEAQDHRFATISFPGIQILGGTLLVPPSPEIFEHLFRQIAISFPECRAIEVTGLSTGSMIWKYLSAGHALSREFMLYPTNGPEMCHTLKVPNTFEEYLGAFTRKQRYNHRRQVRRLETFGDGALVLQRIEGESHVRQLHEARIALSGHAKQTRDIEKVPEDQLLDLAQRGLLHSYVLSADGKPCGLGYGTRFRDTLCMHSFLHDTDINHLSPGTVLQTLMMKDVIEDGRVRRIDFGFGASRYRLLNDLDERVSAFLMKGDMTNQLLLNAHRSYLRMLRGAKNIVEIASRRPGQWES